MGVGSCSRWRAACAALGRSATPGRARRHTRHTGSTTRQCRGTDRGDGMPERKLTRHEARELEKLLPTPPVALHPTSLQRGPDEGTLSMDGHPPDETDEE